jgi:hypothetical protein
MAKNVRRSGMRHLTAIQALAQAESLAAKARDPKAKDDPDWLMRRVIAWQKAGERRQRAKVRKDEARRKSSRKGKK